GGREVRVAALAGERAMSLPVKKESRLAQAGSCRNYRGVASGIGGSLIEYREVFGIERRDTEGISFEIINQANAIEPRFACQRCRLHGPLQVRHLGASLAHRPRNSEAGCARPRPVEAQKRADRA